MDKECANVLAVAIRTEGTIHTGTWEKAGLPFELWLTYCKVGEEGREEFHKSVLELADGE